jgi:hypothetical protein
MVGILLALCGCTGTATRNTEELRTLGRRLVEIRGEIDNSIQILAACAAQHESQAIASAAASGILAIVGPPDAAELSYAISLDAQGVSDVTAHGLALVKKREQLVAAYASTRDRLTDDYQRTASRASIFSSLKFLTLAGALVFLLVFLRR